MDEIIAKCGYRCDICPAYVKNFDKNEKLKISYSWEKYFGFKVPTDLFGDGCPGCQSSKETLDKDCQIRPCASKKQVKTCAHCENFGCDTLKTRALLVENNLQMKVDDIPKEDYSKYIDPFDGIKYLNQLKDSLDK